MASEEDSLRFRDFLTGSFLETTPSPRLAGWLAVAYLGIVGSALTFTLFFWLLTRGNILRVAMVSR